jgi:hypothetical protein
LAAGATTEEEATLPNGSEFCFTGGVFKTANGDCFDKLLEQETVKLQIVKICFPMSEHYDLASMRLFLWEKKNFTQSLHYASFHTY